MICLLIKLHADISRRSSPYVDLSISWLILYCLNAPLDCKFIGLQSLGVFRNVRAHELHGGLRQRGLIALCQRRQTRQRGRMRWQKPSWSGVHGNHSLPKNSTIDMTYDRDRHLKQHRYLCETASDGTFTRKIRVINIFMSLHKNSNSREIFRVIFIVCWHNVATSSQEAWSLGCHATLLASSHQNHRLELWLWPTRERRLTTWNSHAAVGNFIEMPVVDRETISSRFNWRTTVATRYAKSL